MAIGQDLLNVPMGEMIRQMALAIAEAQIELDESSMYVAEMMSGQVVVRDDNDEPVEDDTSGDVTTIDTRVFFGREKDDAGKLVPVQVSMLELGFVPTFYQFIDTIIEVKISITISREREKEVTKKGSKITISKGRRGYRITSTPVNATYSSKYSYSAEGSSLLRTKMAPVPPPSILEERIRQMLEDNVEEAGG